MAKECLFWTMRAAAFLQFLAIAAAATLAFLLLSMPIAKGVAADQQSLIAIGNSSLCSSIDDADGEDAGGCFLPMAQAQPKVEGFGMTTDMGLGFPGRALERPVNVAGVTGGAKNKDKAACDRNKNGRYISCTTDAKQGFRNKCTSVQNRECHA